MKSSSLHNVQISFPQHLPVVDHRPRSVNSSSQIATITDAVSLETTSYTFWYTNERLSSISDSQHILQWPFIYATGTGNTPWTPNQNPANTVQMLKTATHSQTGGSQSFEY